MREIWKSIPGWEGLYVVSNLARVKHLPYTKGKGKDIYDGDILAHNGGPFGYVVDGVRGYCFDVIYFSHEYEESWSLYGVVINDFNGEVEIAGNIHDSHKDCGALNLKNK